MNWVERRALLEGGIPEFWNVLCIDLEQALAAFGQEFGQKRKAVAIPKRKGDCIHIMYVPFGAPQPERAIDICLDRAQRRVFSRLDGEERTSRRFESDPEGKPVLVDDEGSPITNDQASELFLRAFLFP